MAGFDIAGAKKLFFDSQKVIRAVSAAERRVMIRIGGKIRVTAKRSIRKARQKKIGELTPAELKRFRQLQRIGRQKGFKPRRPLKASEPGQPARARFGGSASNSPLRKNILFLYDSKRKSVIVGPARMSKQGDAPHVLEHGGRARLTRGPDKGKSLKIDARPTMQLALAKVTPDIQKLWKDQVR